MGVWNKFGGFITDRKIKLNSLERIGMFIDFSLEKVIHGVPMDDYFKYEFYLKNRRGRKAFASGKKKRSFYAKMNNQKSRNYLDDKSLFLKKYSEFVKRDSISLKETDYEQFLSFCRKNPNIFAKPANGHFGIGAKKYHLTDDNEIKKAYEEMKGQDYVAETLIIQSSELAAFNTSSINTIRIMTFVDDNYNVEVLPYAALRLGRAGRIADNFHYDGISSMIDTTTGYVITKGIDQHGNRFVVHPDSQVPIVGFLVPKWKEMCETVKKAALVCPDVRCVGWDLTLAEDDSVIIIEGNGRPDPDIIQTGDGIGKWYLYEEMYSH